MLYLDPDEHVLLEVRKHWIVFVSEAAGHIVAAFLPFILYTIFVHVSSSQYQINLGGNILLFFYSVWLLILWVSFFVQWTKYYLDVWYVTEKRIIDVNQTRLFDRTMSNLRFDKIQDITVEVNGLLATFLDIGSIEVQTAAEDSGDFIIKRAAHPEQVRSFIFSQHNFASEQYLPHRGDASAAGPANVSGV